MGRATSTAVLQNLGRLFEAGTVAGLAEGQLLDRFVRRRDASAFEVLIERHGPMVLGVCRRILRDPNDVEDAFQATFLVLVRKAGSIRDRGILGPWLHSVASKTALRARANARRHSGVIARSLVTDPLDELAFDPRDAHDRVEHDGILDEEVGRLPEKYRTPLVLCYFEGLTHEQAAARLRWPVGTVRGRLARARDRLRDRLTRRGITLSVAFAAAGLTAEGAKAKLCIVSAALVESTRRASLAFTAGKGLFVPFAAPSTPVILLTHQILRGSIMFKLTGIVSAFGVAAAVATGVVGALQDPAPATSAGASTPSAATATGTTTAAPAAASFTATAITPSTPAAATFAATVASPAARGQQNPPIAVSVPAGRAPEVTVSGVAIPTPAAAARGVNQTSGAAQPAFTGTVPAVIGSPLTHSYARPAANAEDPEAFLAKTQREIEAAMRALALEEQHLTIRLKKVSRDLLRLKQMREALGANQSVSVEGLELPAISENPLSNSSVDFGVEYSISEAQRLSQPTTVPASVVTVASTSSAPIQAEVALAPEPVATSLSISTSQSELEAKLNKLLDSMVELRKEVEAIKSGR